MNKSYETLCGSLDIENAASLPALTPFDPRIMAFLADVSGLLLKTKEAKAYPDVITFAFFCRRASLEQKEKQHGDESRMGRGLAFHIAPSNVPINFAYSLVAGLLSGNACVVKASSQNFAQTRMVCAVMASLLAGSHSALSPYVNVITYPRDRQDITELFSNACDVRIIWGGDETVRRVREAALPPHAFDVTFADRYSLLCVDPEAVLALTDAQLAAMAQGFYNDTFLTDQNACTSPRLIYWLTDGAATALAAAKERFWAAIRHYASARYTLPPVIAVDKLTALYRGAVEAEGLTRVATEDNLCVRIRAEKLSEALLEVRCAGGFFVEYEDTSLEALAAIGVRKVQTLSYLGVDPQRLKAFVLERGLKGIDRIVPLGNTMDFGLIWDGYDLIQTLSRQVTAL